MRVRAAEIARRSGMYAVEMRALHTAVRFDDRSQTERLAELAKTLKTSLAEAIAEHARGLADHDGDLLDAAADRFADMGALALAADAAAQAAREHARARQLWKQIKSSTRAHKLAEQGGIRTPAVDGAASPLPITAREREIVNLVAAGLSNRQIADRLVVSVRTVEGHVYRIFAKLGIDDREQLVHLVRLAWRRNLNRASRFVPKMRYLGQLVSGVQVASAGQISQGRSDVCAAVSGCAHRSPRFCLSSWPARRLSRPLRTSHARHLAAVTLRLPTRPSPGPALPSPKPAPWSCKQAGRSTVVPRAGGAPRALYPCGSALSCRRTTARRCRRTAARPCCSSSWMCLSQPHR